MTKISKIQKKAGMTYVELIVVLGIFATMSSVVIFNYRDFQAKVDIKNLASDIALKIVEAQKASLSGELSTETFSSKPSYGVYFNLADNKSLIYFADLNNTGGYEAGEILGLPMGITKGNYIESIQSCSAEPCGSGVAISPLSIYFKRPNTSAIFFDHQSGEEVSDFSYIQITISSPSSIKSYIKIYPSGRIQVD